MGRRPCCDKEGLNRGSWSAWEDKILSNYVELHGKGKWRDLPQKAGLKRCGKSCRLRWLNYLRPDIKRGDISFEEEELIIRLHKLLGNRWSLIAGRLPGRTDNEIKNYWNTNLSKRSQSLPSKIVEIPKNKISRTRKSLLPPPPPQPHPVIRTKAVRCSKVMIPRFQTNILEYPSPKIVAPTSEEPSSSPPPPPQIGETADFFMNFNMDGLLTCDALNSVLDEGENNNGDFLVPEIKDEEGILHGILNPYETFELHTLASFLDSEDEWITENNKVS